MHTHTFTYSLTLIHTHTHTNKNSHTQTDKHLDKHTDKHTDTLQAFGEHNKSMVFQEGIKKHTQLEHTSVKESVDTHRKNVYVTWDKNTQGMWAHKEYTTHSMWNTQTNTQLRGAFKRGQSDTSEFLLFLKELKLFQHRQHFPISSNKPPGVIFTSLNNVHTPLKRALGGHFVWPEKVIWRHRAFHTTHKHTLKKGFYRKAKTVTDFRTTPTTHF